MNDEKDCNVINYEINYYANLMRIKAAEQSENKELDYQIKVQKIKLAILGIDAANLAFD